MNIQFTSFYDHYLLEKSEIRYSVDCRRNPLLTQRRENIDISSSTRNQQIAKRIDGEVTKLLSTGANDLAIFTGIAHQMGDFRILLDVASPGEMDLLCAQYKGFHRYANILEDVAQGIEAGEIHVPR